MSKSVIFSHMQALISSQLFNYSLQVYNLRRNGQCRREEEERPQKIPVFQREMEQLGIRGVHCEWCKRL